MATPVEVAALVSAISPETMDRFFRAKLSGASFESCRTDGGFFRIDLSDARDPLEPGARPLRQFLDVTADDSVQVVGRFRTANGGAPVLVYSVPLKGEISSRAARRTQADFARCLLKLSKPNLSQYRSDWNDTYGNAIFFFYDTAGNFRMSLIESGEKRFRRFTFFVEHDATGTRSRTFRYRMTNAASNDKAARGELEKWNHYQDIKAAFSVETLNKEFYGELSNWYFWALQQVKFPEAAGDKEEERNARSLIRLITRLMFVWFMKQKGLIPEDLFSEEKIKGMLKLEDPTGSTYYKAVLQNLFFATLNTEMGKDRRFVEDEPERQGVRKSHGIQYFYRYQRYLRDPRAFLELMRDIPFLNGGLFTCLDQVEYDSNGKKTKEVRIDGFSTHLKNAELLAVPDTLFWDGTGLDQKTREPAKTFDLTEITGKKEKVGVHGLIPLLQRYNFTVDESSKNDETVALDPELLGRVFENLLASYNPETSTTARKATGSFYTPREIVNYMVEESLIHHLKTTLKVDDATTETALRRLVADGEADAQWFSAERTADAIKALKGCSILDPACGSGAFPMGILQAMLRALEALDPIGEDDTKLYQRKLELIENCIYGVDIQPIAVQISKLRCFISLLAEDLVDENSVNRGIEPLPNLEMHFVAANSLIGVEKIDGSQVKGKRKSQPGQMEFGDADSEITRLKKELANLRHAWIATRNSDDKKRLPEVFVAKQKELADALTRNEWYGQEQAKKLVTWNPFDQNTPSKFFDMEWMFGGKDGFDVVIGNPPYINIEKIPPCEREIFLPLYGDHGKLGKRYDIYQLFIMKGVETLSEAGVLSFILPNTFLMGASYLILRRRLCARTSLLHIVDLPQGVFENATVDNVLLFAQNPRLAGNAIRIAKLDTHSNIQLMSTREWDDAFEILQDDLTEDTAYKLNVHVNPRLAALFSRIETGSVRLGEVTESSQGIILYKTAADATESRYTSTTKQSGWKKLLRGTNIGYYCTKWGGEYVHYGDWLWCQRDEKFFNQPKILLHAMRNKALKRRLVGTYDTEKYYNAHNLANIISKKGTGYDLRYVLALFNSTLINHWYCHHFPNVNINPNDFRQIPLCVVNEAEQAPFIELVDRILAAKKADPVADTSAWEREIDDLVYQLYGLTDKEIAIVKAASDGAKETDKSASESAGEDTTESPEAVSAPTVQPAPKRRGQKPTQAAGLDL